jgi:hypothetical protein
MRLEGVHAQLVSQGEGLLVEGYSQLDVWGLAMHGDLAIQPLGPCFVAPLLVRTSERQHPLRQSVRLLQAASQ